MQDRRADRSTKPSCDARPDGFVPGLDDLDSIDDLDCTDFTGDLAGIDDGSVDLDCVARADACDFGCTTRPDDLGHIVDIRDVDHFKCIADFGYIPPSRGDRNLYRRFVSGLEPPPPSGAAAREECIN